MRAWLQTRRGMVTAWLAALLPLLFVTDLADALWIGCTIAALIFIKEARSATFDWVYKSAGVSILIGFLVGFGVFASDFVMLPMLEEMTGSEINSSKLADLQGNTGQYIQWMIAGILLGGVMEEVFFRGFFIGWGTQLFGDRWAVPLVILVALLFGLGHSDQALVGQISTGISGLIFGITYLACGKKLLPAIIAHGASNGLTITWIFLYGLRA